MTLAYVTLHLSAPKHQVFKEIAIRWSVIPVGACAALLLAASPASAAVTKDVPQHLPANSKIVVVNDPPGTQYSNTWEMPVPDALGTMHPLWDAGVCRGSFSNLIQNVSTVQYGAYWQCTSSVLTTVRANVQECDLLANGQYYCYLGTQATGRTATNTAYFNRSDAYFGCTPDKTTFFRPVATYLSVQGNSVTKKYGTPNLGTC